MIVCGAQINNIYQDSEARRCSKPICITEKHKAIEALNKEYEERGYFMALPELNRASALCATTLATGTWYAELEWRADGLKRAGLSYTLHLHPIPILAQGLLGR